VNGIFYKMYVLKLCLSCSNVSHLRTPFVFLQLVLLECLELGAISVATASTMQNVIQ